MSLQSSVTAPASDLLGAAPASVSIRWESVAVARATPIWQRLAALIGLVLLSPVALAIAIATRITSPGPVLYRGQRVGRGGKIFTIIKFRTLELNAEQKIGARLLEHSDGLYTRIGRYLKRAKLDEIPQLWNVVRGDMN